jgi:hypothetical protein
MVLNGTTKLGSNFPSIDAQNTGLFVGDAKSDNDELTWYAAQEIAIHLPIWQAE